jgi:hypothetical protein
MVAPEVQGGDVREVDVADVGDDSGPLVLHYVYYRALTQTELHQLPLMQGSHLLFLLPAPLSTT